MPIALANLPSAWPKPRTKDADLRARMDWAARRLRAWQDLFSQLASTTWFNIGLIEDPDATSAEQERALDTLARRLARLWKVADRRVRYELIRRAKAQGIRRTQAKVNALESAVWLTLRGDIDEPHTLYFRPEGRLVDEAAHKLIIVPSALPTPFADRWALSHIIKLAEAQLLDETIKGYEQTRTRRAQGQAEARLDSDGLGDIEDSDADPLYIFLEGEAGRRKPRSSTRCGAAPPQGNVVWSRHCSPN